MEVGMGVSTGVAGASVGGTLVGVGGTEPFIVSGKKRRSLVAAGEWEGDPLSGVGTGVRVLSKAGVIRDLQATSKPTVRQNTVSPTIRGKRLLVISLLYTI